MPSRCAVLPVGGLQVPYGTAATLAQQLAQPSKLDSRITAEAAQAIGDDQLQRQARGVVVPESFTHGTSAQRVRWFTQGFTLGDPRQCDTFKAVTL